MTFPTSLSILRISDGTTTVDLHAKKMGFSLVNWRPVRPALKRGGTWQSSPLADGRRLRDARYDHAIDTFRIRANHHSQDDLIEQCQEADRLLIKGMEYWTTDWQHEPVWIEAKGPKETNTRYAIVHTYRFPRDDNPYAQPFFQCFHWPPGTNELTIIIEHGHWQSRPPCGRDNVSEGAFEPQESADDARADSGAGGSISTVLVYDTSGKDAAGDTLDSGVRFHSVSIAPGSRILSAHIAFVCATASVNDDCNVLIVGERDPVPPSFAADTYATFQGRLTNVTESVAWHQIEHWVVGISYNTPDLSLIIQEIIDLAEWSSGNDLVIFIADHSSTATAYRAAASWDNPDYPAPVLYVEWVADADECYDCVPIGARQAYPNMEYDGPWMPEQSADDKSVRINLTQGFGIAGTTLSFGQDPNPDTHGHGIRFRDVTVKPGSTILAARIDYTAASAQVSTTCDATIDGEDNAFPAVFTDAVPGIGWGDYNGRVRTTASIAWNNVGAWVAGTVYSTPDIATVVQEIVNIPGWASSNNMVIFCEDNSSAGGYREAASWDNVTYNEPRLYIDWVNEDGFHRGSFSTCKDQVYVANKHNRAQITHIYRFIQGTGFECENLVGKFECGNCEDLFPDPMETGDYIVFGIDTSLDDSGPFCSLVFNIGTPAAYEGLTPPNDGIAWRYWDGFNWTLLTVQDNTHDSGAMTTNYQGPFNTAGVNSVHWIPPSDWTAVAVCGVTALWVSCHATIASGSISTPTQCDQEIYTIVWPYVETELARTDVFLPLIQADDITVNRTIPGVNLAANLNFGQTALWVYDSAIRFRNVAIPRNAIILDAYASFVATLVLAGDDCDLRLYGEQNASPAEFTNVYADYLARVRTGHSADWDGAEHWTTGDTYRSVSCPTVVQEIVNLGGWETGNDLVIFVQDNGSAVNAYRTGAGVFDTDYRPPMLCVTWIDPDMLGGDIAALAIDDYDPQSDHTVETNTGLKVDQVLFGLRSLERGENYSAYINMANEQNPTGIAVIGMAPDTILSANIEAPTGIAARYAPGAIRANLDNEVWITFDEQIIREYFGIYHCFLRAEQDAGVAGDINIRIAICLGNLDVWYSPVVTFNRTGLWIPLDFGRIVIPGFLSRPQERIVNFRLNIQVSCSNAAATMWIYDLILLPIDEWASNATTPYRANDVRSSMGAEIYLHMDGITSPKDDIRAIRRSFVNDPTGLTNTGGCTVIANGPPIFQSNKAQRLWFFAKTLSTAFLEWPAESLPCVAARVRADALQRYLSMRGKR